MDPKMFRNKALDPEAENFIETWARALSPRSQLDLALHLKTM